MGTIRALAVFLLLGGAAAAQEHPQDPVIASYSQALERWPAGGAAKEKAVLYYNRGVAYSAKGDLAAAVSDYGASLELDPGNFDSLYNRGVAYQKLKRWDAALADLDQAIGLKPGDGQAWLSRGVVRHEKGDLEGAVADYDRAAALAPGEARALQYKGSALQELAARKAAPSAPADAPAAPEQPGSSGAPVGWTLERVKALPIQAKAGAAAAVLALASLLAGLLRPKEPPPLSPAEAALAAFEEKGRLDPGDYPLVVSALKALGKLPLLENAALPPEHRIAVAEALMDAGEETAGLAFLSREGGSPWGKAEFACALRLCQRLDDFSAAEGVFQKIGHSPQLGPREAGELAYLFAIFCERKGAVERAKGIYLDLIGRFGRFKDTARRLVNLETAARGAPLAPELGGGGAGLIAGKFELRETLGIGGMGVVYKAFDRTLSREVAVKRMRREITGDEASRRRFLEEARMVATLSHPNVVSIHEIAATGSDVFLVFEFVVGETLWQILNARGPFAPAECARVLRQTAEALEAAHAQNIIHRDLKPLNIMRDRRGLVKVMDFGIAGHGVASFDDPGSVLVCGTPGYMAPEQYQGLCSPRSDLFALGVTAYELLTGELPFPGPDHLGQITTGFYQELPAGVPGNLRRLVAACLRADEKSRPAGAADFLKELGDPRNV